MIEAGFSTEELQDEIRTLRAVSLATYDTEEAEACARVADLYSRLLASLLAEESTAVSRPPSDRGAHSVIAQVLQSIRRRAPVRGAIDY